VAGNARPHRSQPARARRRERDPQRERAPSIHALIRTDDGDQPVRGRARPVRGAARRTDPRRSDDGRRAGRASPRRRHRHPERRRRAFGPRTRGPGARRAVGAAGERGGRRRGAPQARRLAESERQHRRVSDLGSRRTPLVRRGGPRPLQTPASPDDGRLDGGRRRAAGHRRRSPARIQPRDDHGRGGAAHDRPRSR
jgi:hypothetical protein